jgi:hypothetical protein
MGCDDDAAASETREGRRKIMGEKVCVVARAGRATSSPL